ncbi:hypothetical protein R3X27_00975 [Tropicimonas sp. TH_r6]|nr:hypothetical protein [Tropicimonas sp. TH_r6]MDV7141244.1 hypothetical protein [Tropicimonas sp. TH_r6]
MCDFFGIEESELLLPHGQFMELIRLKPHESSARAEKNVVSAIGEDIRLASRRELDSYVGFYFGYYHSMSHPGMVLRSLTRLYRTPFGVNVKSIEMVGSPGARQFTCKYEGACFVLGDRIFMTVMEMLTRNEVMQIILYPCYTSRIRFLTGVISGVAARAPRPPTATQIVFQYLGDGLDIRKSLRLSGLYAPDDPEIPQEVRRMLSGPSAFLEAPLP